MTIAEHWNPDELRILGKSRKRFEDRALVTGQGRFVADLATPETLHASFVRSPIPHGTLNSVEVGQARSMPGVVAILTGNDLGLPDLAPPLGLDRSDVTRPLLAKDRVRYVGEPIAIVIADSEVTAVDAAGVIWPDIDDLPTAMAWEPDEARVEPRLFTEDNVMTTSLIESDSRVHKELPVSVTVETHSQRVAALAIEGLTVLCEPDPDGRLTVTCGHQAPHRLKAQLASALGIGPDRVRVVVPDVGGAFGLKGVFFTEYAVVCAAAARLNKPVMWLESRREHLTAGTHGRSQTHRVTFHGETSGRIRRARVEIVADVGAYPQSGFLIPSISRFVAGGLYDIEDLTIKMSIAVTNRAPTGPYRGAGRPEAAFAIERAIDSFARKAGLDPAEVRRINFITKESLPYSTATGATYDSGDYEAALARALELVDVDAVRTEQTRRLKTGLNPLGLGIGAFIERTGGPADSGEFADVELNANGEVVVRTGSTAAGQGHQTVWAQTVAEVFDIDPARVSVVAGDTDEVAEGVGTYGSRSTQAGASAAFRMAIRVREQAREIAAEMLEASPADLILESGAFQVVGVPASAIPLAEVATHGWDNGTSLRHQEMYVPGIQTFPYGVHIAVVEVDLETGLVQIQRMIAVDDCGNVLNPMIVQGQLHGSLVQGIGQALMEEIVYSEDAIPITATMMDYPIPRAVDIPEIISDRLVHPAPSNPLGVKGTGEAGCIGAPPAIVNAALDALAPYDVTELQMPLRANRVWQAIQAARSVAS